MVKNKEHKTVIESEVCVFKSQRYGKVKLPAALVDKWGKERITEVIKYVDAYGVNIRNWAAYISSALVGRWDLSVSEGELIPDKIGYVPGVEETKKYLQTLNIKRSLTQEDHERVRDTVNDFLVKVGAVEKK